MNLPTTSLHVVNSSGSHLVLYIYITRSPKYSSMILLLVFIVALVVVGCWLQSQVGLNFLGSASPEGQLA